MNDEDLIRMLAWQNGAMYGMLKALEHILVIDDLTAEDKNDLSDMVENFLKSPVPVHFDAVKKQCDAFNKTKDTQ